MSRNPEALLTRIKAIVSTIMTDIPLGGIEYIMRQGDCALIRLFPQALSHRGDLRHLTEVE